MIKQIKNQLKLLEFSLRASNEKLSLINDIRLAHKMSVAQYQSLQKMTILELIEIKEKGFNDFRNC